MLNNRLVSFKSLRASDYQMFSGQRVRQNNRKTTWLKIIYNFTVIHNRNKRKYDQYKWIERLTTWCAVMIAFQTPFNGRLSLTAIFLIVNIAYLCTVNSSVLAATNAGGGGAARTIAGNGNSNLRLALPRTSASQINSGGVAAASFKLAAKTLNSTRNGNLRTR